MQTQKVKKAAGLALGSSMMLMSMIPAGSVFAATSASPNPYITSVTTTVSGDTATGSAVSKPAGLHIWYQFRVETPSGHWFIARRFGPTDTYTFVPPVSSSGTWYIEAYALTQYQVGKKLWKYQVASTSPVALAAPVSKLVMQGVPTTDIATNDMITLTAVPENSSGTTVTTTTQATWTVTTSSGVTTSGATVQALASGDRALFDATTPGDYTVTATLGTLTTSATIDVFGEASAVQISPAAATLVADGSATDTITATVVDSNGNVVSNFNGTAMVSVTGVSSVTANTSTVTFTNGVGSFTISGTATGTETVSVMDLTPASGSTESSTISYGSATVTLTAPVATGLMISPTTATMLAAPDQSQSLSVNLVDELGNLMPTNFATGFDVVTLNIVGPGSFVQGNASATSETVYVAAGLPANVMIYDPTGASGTILVTASASGLTEGIARIEAEPIGLPATIAVTGTTGTTTVALTSSTNKINLSAGTQYAQYTITLEDANGTPVPAPAAETFAVTDNAVTGVAYVLEATANGPAGTAEQVTSATSSTATVVLPAGASSVSFDVVNTTTQSQPGLLSISTVTGDYAEVSPVEAVLSASASAPYTFVTGPVATVDVTGPGDVINNGTATYTAQISDINDNLVAETGTVTFTISASASGVASFANGASTVTEQLSPEGNATVTVYAGSVTGTYTVTASADSYMGSTTAQVVNLASLVTNLAVETGSPLAPVSSSGVTLGGLGSATFTVYERNGVDSVVTPTDNVTVTVSNPSAAILEYNGAPVSGNTLVLAPSSFTTNSGAVFSILGGTTGTVMVTVSDASNPSVGSVTFPVAVQGLSSAAITVAGESGAGNVAGDTAKITVNGSTVTANYASAITDFGQYDQQAGELTVLTPSIISGTVYSGTTSVYSGSLAVWDVSGQYYYLALDETPNTSEGAASGTDYVGIQVTGPTGSTVQMAVNSGAYDNNTSNVDYAYIAVATENNGSWSVAPAMNFVLNTKVSLPSPGPTVVYPIAISQP
ncbi:MAG: hypothetical protein OWU33_10430 [Firmicutes bacterium]|nr:hypothetical protein [Bacillota bacterium]